MEQQTATATATETKVVIKRTIPNKQKTTLKLILWTLTRVMDLETANAKAIEMFKLGESIETIIEEVDNIEKSAEYAEMETNLASLCVKPAKKSRAKKEATTISGDADTIIKEMVEMATAEVKTTPVKKPRVKKVAGETDVLVPVLDEETKPLAKAKARTKTTTKKTKNVIDDDSRPEPTWVDTPESVVEVETRLRHNNPKSSTEVSSDVKVDEPETKPATKPATKSKVVSEDDNVEKEEPIKKSRAKPATKPATKSKTVEPQEETPVTNDLAEEEYLVLNEVEYEGKQYMVGGDQNVYDEFNSIIGKYENGIITLNA
jgi:hypothetical protein